MRSNLGSQALTTLGAATRDNFLAVLGGHARAEAVTALAHESAWLVGAFHGLLRLRTIALNELSYLSKEARGYDNRPRLSTSFRPYAIRIYDVL
jgi:hypothetical protein